MSNRTITIVLIAFFILLAAGFMAYYYQTTRMITKSLPVFGNPGHKVDTFSFYNQDGRLITQKDVRDKVYVVEYFFATCKGMCPKMNEQMKRVYEAYRGNPDVLILSHTVDPEKDSVSALKAHSRQFNADGKQWMFVTGSKQRLYDMARESYLISADDTSAKKRGIKEDFIHDPLFILIDRTGHLRGQYDGLESREVDTLISDIHLLLEEKGH